jgi:hypothetical protein
MDRDVLELVSLHLNTMNLTVIRTFVAITVWHLTVHKHQMEWSTIVAGSLKRIDRLEAVKIRIALEAKLLNEGYRYSLID